MILLIMRFNSILFKLIMVWEVGNFREKIVKILSQQLSDKPLEEKQKPASLPRFKLSIEMTLPS